MAALADLVSRLRLELGDPPMPFQARVVADGQTDRFNLPAELVDSATLTVFRNGVLLDEGVDYTMDYRAGVLSMDAAPADGDEIVVDGHQSETFLTEDLQTYVMTAYAQHAHGRKDSLGRNLLMADLPGVEDYLVILLARIEALWALITDAAQEIDVRSPDGVTIPVHQRYEQLIGLIGMLKAEYRELAQSLNVGLHRIEMFTLRRVSRTTNRLIPLYQTMEYDQIAKGFVPDRGPAGTEVVIKGTGFTGATEVTFGGVPSAEFYVINDALIQATVPEGALTGQISVTTPGGVVTSHYNFTVGWGAPEIVMGATAMRLRPPIDDGVM